MRFCENGVMRDATAEEMAEMHRLALAGSRAEKQRPLTWEEVIRLLIEKQIGTLEVEDNLALRMAEFYPVWTAGTAYPAGHIAAFGGGLWRSLQAHTAQAGWEPEAAPALWERIVRSYEGTQDDPIPYEGNLRLESGKHYIQDEVVYLCTRDTEGPVYHGLAELLGLYVEVE
jgi:hypothetical protein